MLAEKTLTNINRKTGSTNDGLKTSLVDIGTNSSRWHQLKINSTKIGQKKPSCYRPKNYIGFKNWNKYLIHIQLIGLDLKSKKLDLDMKWNHLNEFKVN